MIFKQKRFCNILSNTYVISVFENFLRSPLKNKFFFDSKIIIQVFGTAMGTKCAPPYACLPIGYQDETKLFTQELPKYFPIEEYELIKVFKRYMHDGLIFWPELLDFE